MAHETLYLMTVSEDVDVLAFMAQSYGRCMLTFALLAFLPALLALAASRIMRRDRRFFSPSWMCPAWAAESDAYKLLFQEIYSAHDVRLWRVAVGAGAIAMQALVMLLILLHLHKKMIYSRLSPDDKMPFLFLEGRCVAFAMMACRILQGDTRRDLKMMRYAAKHPGPVAGNACAFAIAGLGALIGLVNASLGAVLIVRAPDLLVTLTTFAGLGFIMEIDNWFVNVFELSSNDLHWLEKEAFDAFDLNHDGVISPEEFKACVEQGAEARVEGVPRVSKSQRRTGFNVLAALRSLIFFGVYPAVLGYLWLYYIPDRSIP
mmetsp:Transcript_20968/g.62548  ORF Transcript_20968/g.62548 Transcript_20968/m.62548 type:complete len:318 (-) Transcript_20968:44-997(-)